MTGGVEESLQLIVSAIRMHCQIPEVQGGTEDD